MTVAQVVLMSSRHDRMGDEGEGGDMGDGLGFELTMTMRSYCYFGVGNCRVS